MAPHHPGGDRPNAAGLEGFGEADAPWPPPPSLTGVAGVIALPPEYCNLTPVRVGSGCIAGTPPKEPHMATADPFTLTALHRMQDERLTPEGGWMTLWDVAARMDLRPSQHPRILDALKELHEDGMIEKRFNAPMARDEWRSRGVTATPGRLNETFDRARKLTMLDLNARQVGPGSRVLLNGWDGDVVVSFTKTHGTPTSWKWHLTSGYRFGRPVEPAGSARTYSAALEQVIRATSVHGILGPEGEPVALAEESVEAVREAARHTLPPVKDRPSKAHEDAVDALIDAAERYMDPNGGQTGEDLWESLLTLGWMPPRNSW